MEATGATQLAWVSVAMSRVTRAVREGKREAGDKNALELVKTVSLTPANGKALIVAALATHPPLPPEPRYPSPRVSSCIYARSRRGGEPPEEDPQH